MIETASPRGWTSRVYTEPTLNREHKKKQAQMNSPGPSLIPPKKFQNLLCYLFNYFPIVPSHRVCFVRCNQYAVERSPPQNPRHGLAHMSASSGLLLIWIPHKWRGLLSETIENTHENSLGKFDRIEIWCRSLFFSWMLLTPPTRQHPLPEPFTCNEAWALPPPTIYPGHTLSLPVVCQWNWWVDMVLLRVEWTENWWLLWIV